MGRRAGTCCRQERVLTAELESRDHQTAELRRRVDALSARLDNAARLTALLSSNLATLLRCLDQFISADVRTVMRLVVNEIHANRLGLHDNRRR